MPCCLKYMYRPPSHHNPVHGVVIERRCGSIQAVIASINPGRMICGLVRRFLVMLLVEFGWLCCSVKPGLPLRPSSLRMK
jgi:hypothetical protein